MLGQVIHGYRIDRAMSEDKGGFGDVYFATHVDSGAEAVVKVLKPEMSARRDIVARFFNEARAAASIHHPGIVQIHNVGRCRSIARSSSCGRPRARSVRRTSAASSIATSSRPTCSSSRIRTSSAVSA